MSTITSIAASDIVSSTRSVINTNFSNLNTDKVETSTLTGSYSTTSTISGTFPTTSILVGSYSTSSTISGSFVSKPVIASVLGSGTASPTTFLRGDLTWATAGGSSSAVGAIGQIQYYDAGAVFAASSTLSWDKNASILTAKVQASSVFAIPSGQIPTSVLGTGTASTSTFLRGDSSWATPSAGWTVVQKTANETIQSDNSLNNDSALTFSMLANTKYAIKIRVFSSTSAAADFQTAITGPASPTRVQFLNIYMADVGAFAAQSFSDSSYTSNSLSLVAGSNQNYVLKYDIIVHNGANAGTFAYQWAQVTSNASDTTVYAGSTLEYIVIA